MEFRLIVMIEHMVNSAIQPRTVTFAELEAEGVLAVSEENSGVKAALLTLDPASYNQTLTNFNSKISIV